jgi:hypothetical protein
LRKATHRHLSIKIRAAQVISASGAAQLAPVIL